MSVFAEAFRRHVTPDLKKSIRGNALLMALGSQEFSDAYATVAALAIRRGASHLAPERLDELLDWIGSALLDEAEAFEPEIAEYQKMADRVCRDG